MSTTPYWTAAWNHVTLETIGVANTGDPKQDLDFIRINQDGIRPAGPPWFRVLTGQVFVITDVDWQYDLGAAGQIQTFRIFIENLADPTKSNRVFESTIVLNNQGQGDIRKHDKWFCSFISR